MQKADEFTVEDKTQAHLANPRQTWSVKALLARYAKAADVFLALQQMASRYGSGKWLRVNRDLIEKESGITRHQTITDAIAALVEANWISRRVFAVYKRNSITGGASFKTRYLLIDVVKFKPQQQPVDPPGAAEVSAPEPLEPLEIDIPGEEAADGETFTDSSR